MIRKIITIDDGKCNGCGLCVEACHEGAIGLQGGKAVLLRDDYCDGLGDCLPACPAGAISFEEREALAYDEAAVLANMAAREGKPLTPLAPLHFPVSAPRCPGSQARSLAGGPVPEEAGSAPSHPSRLAQWPVQIKLVPVNAPYFADADLLVAADCSAFACGNFHEEFMHGKVTIIGCPKLDEGDYSVKLADILRRNTVRSVTVARMSVPCCGGIEQAARRAVTASGKDIPLSVVTLSPEGRVVART